MLGGISVTVMRNGFGSQVHALQFVSPNQLMNVLRSNLSRHHWRCKISVIPSNHFMAFLFALPYATLIHLSRFLTLLR